MIYRQLFDKTSSTYTCLLAERQGGVALLIDPVPENTDRYARLIEELDLKLELAVDTRIHADHVTGLGTLRDRTGCASAMGAMTRTECVSLQFREGEKLLVDKLQVSDKQACIDLMNALEPADPRLMDIAVPANRACDVLNAA